MKTFDLALKYLEGIDFKQFAFVVKGKWSLTEQQQKIIDEAGKRFLSDKKNTVSNEYYRSVCFEAAIFHSIFKAHNQTSFFIVACGIVEFYKDVLKTKHEKHGAYPKLMVDEWDIYLNNLKETTQILDNELAQEFLLTAYHYVIGISLWEWIKMKK